MKNIKRLIPILILSIASLFFFTDTSVAQETADQLFEKALYKEEATGDLQQAIDLYQKILKESPENREVVAKSLVHLGLCYEKIGSPEAYKTYQDVINKYIEHKDEVAIALARVEYLDAYAADINETAEKHITEGNELYKVWEYESAIEEYKNAIQLKPNTLIAQNAQYYIGQSYFKAGRYEEALATFKKIIEENPESTIAPVTELMIAQVQHEKEKNKNLKNITNHLSNKGVIIDPITEIKYTQVNTLTGKSDIIENTKYSSELNLSPNGKFLLSGNLMVVPLNGDYPFSLVDMPAGRGAWSPDGDMVAFYANDAIWVVPVSPETGRTTGSPTKLLDGKYRYQFVVSWSPDAEKLVFSRRDEKITDDIWTISVSDRSLTQITGTPGYEMAPAWSPDGNTIAFGRYDDKHSLWLSSVDGKNIRKIIDNEHRCIPVWSPDGQWILLNEEPRLIRLADNKDYALSVPDEVGSFFSWSIDTTKMLFYSSSYDYQSLLKVVSSKGGPILEIGKQITLWPYEHFWSVENNIIITQGVDNTGNPMFWIIPLGQGEPIPLILDVQVKKPMNLCLSRDCKLITFSDVIDDGIEDLWVVPFSLEQGRTIGQAVKVFEGHQRYSGSGGSSEQSWSPDGSKFALSQNGDIWIVNTDGSGSNKITNSPELEGWPRWSPDGRMIQTVVKSGDDYSLQIISASEGQPIKKIENLYDLDWSPDGKELAVAFKNGHLSVLAVTSEKTVQIADLKDIGLQDVYDLKWSPDGRNIAFIGYHTEKQQSGPIFIIPAVGGTITEVASDDKGWKNYLYWSPDSKWISYHSDGMIKTRPGGTMWEADFEEVLNKIQQ